MPDFTSSHRLNEFRERAEMAYQDAKRVGEYVKAGGWQSWFAERSGIDPASVSRMVNGKEPVHGYAWGALRLIEKVVKLKRRALKAEENISIVLLEDAARAAGQEAERLQEKIDLLRDLCRCPNNRHDELEQIS